MRYNGTNDDWFGKRSHTLCTYQTQYDSGRVVSYEEFGEGFEDDFDALSERQYERAFDKPPADEEVKEFLE